ncbi:MAG TPA: hypothetical protein VL346_09925 [Acidobacteriaceae bacterium]|nr:hypothetical protein [Acidobacteriaceae bacterium]
MADYRVYFSAIFAPQWYYKNFTDSKQTEMPPLGGTVLADDILQLYSKDLDRLYDGIGASGISIELTAEHVVRYEYWVTEENPTSAWSLNRAYGMKTAGIKKWWEGNHRIVICKAKFPRKKRSCIIFRPALRIEGLYPGTFNIANLVDEIKNGVLHPEQGEGAGDAIEMAVTSGAVPIIQAFL